MKDKIKHFIATEIANGPLEDLEMNEDLLASGIIDSLGVMRLIVFLENEFQINVNPEEMTVENFSTLQNITEYVTKQS